jgi:hypothetical protein
VTPGTTSPTAADTEAPVRLRALLEGAGSLLPAFMPDPAAIEELALSHGVCVRPLALKATDSVTGETAVVSVPCGARLAVKCPPCADRARRLRVWQCVQGWHLDHETDLTAPDEADGSDEADAVKDPLTPDDSTPDDPDQDKARRVRSTRRRQDATDLPSRAMAPTTLGRVYTGADGKRFRPSMFVTLTLPSYGKVDQDGTPEDPASYDYGRAARDALVFGRLVDRFVQNLRRVAGYRVQYFAAVEPQRRLAMHVHLAIRGTISRSLLRQVVAATYHQVWWPDTTGLPPVYDARHRPDWDDNSNGGRGGYVDPDTRTPLTSWEDALDQLDDRLDAGEPVQPWHVARFGTQVDAQGMLAGTPAADARIGYLAKYLTKSIADCHPTDTVRQHQHLDRLAAALSDLPCGPSCANWLCYGIQPKHAKPDLIPGACRGKAHRPDHLGYAGRRVLVSRQWSGKTLTEHRDERRDHVLTALGLDPATVRADDKTRDRWIWETTRQTDPDTPPIAQRIWTGIVQAFRQRRDYQTARDATASNSATDLDPGYSAA